MKQMIEIKPPSLLPDTTDTRLKIFLAGSIEMGVAIDWQSKLVEELKTVKDIIILNPRRDEWDPSWEQSITNPEFKAQVNWELDALSIADLIVVYFDENTKSPITMLEFGQYYQSGKMIVACPKGFYRRGNLEVCCSRASVVLLDGLDDLILTTQMSIMHLTGVGI